MKKTVRPVFIFLLFLAGLTAAGQDITGIWRGFFITEGGEQYKYEVQLTQTKKNSLSGVTYSYLDTRFYGKATFTGNYTKSSNAALVQEIKTVELRMSEGSAACIMKCRLVYARSGPEEFLEGVYTSAYEKTDPTSLAVKGANCGGGRVFLRKVSTSDFYVEPFLRNKLTKTPQPQQQTAKAPSIPKKTSKTPPTVTPPVARKTAPKKEPNLSKPIQKPVVIAGEPSRNPEPNTANTRPPITPKIPTIPITIRERKNELLKTVTIGNNSVQVSLYDNGEIDGDTVSIYVDGALLLANKRLSNQPINFTLQLDEANPEHTVVMVAENLGRIPPNTSLMIVQDGDKRHQVSITSSEQKNAMVRFRFEK